ncbi:MAG: SCO family protein [Chloroflexi bacterium]|nr:SCO family protein [Chloroflexota bacterium]
MVNVKIASDAISNGRIALALIALLAVMLIGACGGTEVSETLEPDSQVVGAMSSQNEISDDSMAMDMTADNVAMDMTSDDVEMDMAGHDSDHAVKVERDPFLRRPVERQAAGFTLIDQNGEAVGLNKFRGQWVVMDWIYTNCMTVCPALTSEMLQVRDGLGDQFGSNVHFLSLTFDPDRDSVETMRKYAENVEANTDSWSWLTGSKNETDSVARSFGVSYSPAEAMMGVAMFDHTALTVVIDPGGIECHHYYGVGWSDDMIVTLDNVLPEIVDNTGDAATVAPLAGLSTGASELLAEATSYYWEDWELEDGISVQSVHNFSGKIPTKRYFVARMDGLEENDWINMGREDAGGEALGLYYMFKNTDTDYIGVGTNENVMVEVRGENFNVTLDALFWLGGALCCPA